MFFAWTTGKSPTHWHGFMGLGVGGALGSIVVVIGGSWQEGQGLGVSKPSEPSLHWSLNWLSHESPGSYSKIKYDYYSQHSHILKHILMFILFIAFKRWVMTLLCYSNCSGVIKNDKWMLILSVLSFS